MTELITPPSPTEMGFNNAAQGFFDMNADLRQKPKTPSLRLKSVLAESLKPGPLHPTQEKSSTRLLCTH